MLRNAGIIKSQCMTLAFIMVHCREIYNWYQIGPIMSPIRKLANCRPMNNTSTLKSKPPIAGMMRRIGASIGSVSWWNTYSIGLRPWLTQLRIARINSTQNSKPPAALIKDNKPRNRKSMLNDTEPLEAIRISATN